MNKRILGLFCFLTWACTHVHAQWKPLFNGTDLSGWSVYLSVPHASLTGLDLPKNGDGRYTQPLGRNNDPLGVFKAGVVDGKPCIVAGGQVFGTLTYHEEFANYHLRLRYKWGEKKYAPRLQEVRDGGLIYHAFGEEGASDRTWIPGQECQIQEGDVGDYWPTGTVNMSIPAVEKAGSDWWYYQQGAPLRTQFWSKTMSERRIITELDEEVPHGEWNTVELICFGDSSIHIVNGKVVMRLYHSRKITDGKPERLTSGKIALQSEGAELYYADIEIRPIREIPEAYKE
jgi:hypothetical protein